MKKFISNFQDRSVWILTAIAFLVGTVCGFLKKPFLLHFINGTTYAALFLTACGIAVVFWKDGNIGTERPKDGESIVRLRQKRRKERAGTRNSMLYAGIITMLVSIIMSLLY